MTIWSLEATGPRGGSDLSPSTLAEFRRAQAEVAYATGTSYWGLGCGYLAGDDYVDQFAQAVGAELRDEFWSAEQVRGFARNARWPDPAQVPGAWLSHYLSARRFLETCAATRCGIRFS